MTFKCSPFALLMQKRCIVSLIACLPIACVLCIGPIISGAYYAIPMIVLFLLLFVVILFLSGARPFELTDGKLEYETSFELRRWAGEKHGKTVRATLTVANIQRIEMHQSERERKHNVGNVTFFGKAVPSYAQTQDVLIEYAEKGYDVNDVMLPVKHTFRGVADFDRLRDEIHSQIKDAAVLYNDSYEVKNI